MCSCRCCYRVLCRTSCGGSKAVYSTRTLREYKRTRPWLNDGCNEAKSIVGHVKRARASAASAWGIYIYIYIYHKFAKCTAACQKGRSGGGLSANTCWTTHRQKLVSLRGKTRRTIESTTAVGKLICWRIRFSSSLFCRIRSRKVWQMLKHRP